MSVSKEEKIIILKELIELQRSFIEDLRRNQNSPYPELPNSLSDIKDEEWELSIWESILEDIIKS